MTGLRELLPILFIASAIAPLSAFAETPDANVRSKTERWFDLWNTAADPTDWGQFRALYMPGEGAILVIDDFGDTVTTITSIDEYIATWRPAMAEGFRSWSIEPGEPIDYRIGEDLAVVNFLLVAEGETTSGERVTPRQRGTLIFARDDAGEWRIVQERLTTLAKEDETKADVAPEVRNRILAWGEAWVVGDDAETFELRPIAQEYYVRELLAFDTSDDASKTVIRGIDEFVETWQPFVRSWDHWEFNIRPESITVHPVTDDMAWATLFIDNYGVATDGTEFHGPAQGTLLMERRGRDWKIVHEHISLPRRDP